MALFVKFPLNLRRLPAQGSQQLAYQGVKKSAANLAYRTVIAQEQILTSRLGGHPFVHLLKANMRMMFMAVTKATTVELPVATTSPQRPVFQNTKSFLVKSLYLEPLVSDQAVNKIKKKLEWKFIWTNNGRIYLKQSDSSRSYTFVSGSDLNNFETKMKLPVTDTSKFKSNNKAKLRNRNT